MSARAALPVLFLALVASGCLRLSWNRELRHEPVSEPDIAALEPGRTPLEACLAAFGAPLWVWERVEDRQVKIVLAYGWYNERDVGLRVSVPTQRGVTPYFDYDQIDQKMRGLVLFFDEDCVLVSAKVGLLRDLTIAVRRPPLFLEDLDEGPDRDADPDPGTGGGRAGAQAP